MRQEELEKQMQKLVDIEAIKQLTYRYAEICDDFHNPDRICSVFTHDAVWDGGSEFGKFCGHDQIREGFSQFSKSIGASNHQMTNAIISVNKDEATGVWTASSMLETKNSKPSILAVRYHKKYVRVADNWLIAFLRPELKLKLEMI